MCGAMSEGREDTRSANVLDRQFGQRVRARRLKLGMSQQALGHRLGVTFQQVQKYENGVNRIAASRLCDIAAALDTHPARFFDNPDGASVAASDSLASPEAVDLAALFALIKSVEVRKRVVALVQALAEDT